MRLSLNETETPTSIHNEEGQYEYRELSILIYLA